MPASKTSLRILGSVQTTMLCPLCDREYGGDQKTVQKLIKLHLKKVHDKKVNCTMKASFVGTDDIKKDNEKADAVKEKLQDAADAMSK